MFIIPMAGLSSRFFKAGYELPKYQLLLPNHQTVFEWAVSSFEQYFKTDKFLFIIRDIFDTYNFVNEKARSLGILDYEIVILEDETLGQAHTVYLGLKKSISTIDEDLFIFNIDSKRNNFIKPDLIDHSDAYLEVFISEGDHWSFIEVDDNGHVIRTTEKDRISDLCSNGLYFFKYTSDFMNLVNNALSKQEFSKGELYIAPLYNQLIQENRIINYILIDHSLIEFCGTPDEYRDICTQYIGVAR